MWRRGLFLTILLLFPLFSVTGQSEPGAVDPGSDAGTAGQEAEEAPKDDTRTSEAQESEAADTPGSETSGKGDIPEGDAAAAYLYVLEEITFEIDGWTNPDDVLAFLELEKGAKFLSIEELVRTLELYERDLYNERVFDEVQVTFELLPGEELPRQVAVHFFIDDGWTVLPVVFYRYNSNSGHNPFVVLYWDNFLGTLTDFGFSAGYYSRNWVDPYGWDVRVDLGGIRMLDRKWNFGFDQEFTTVEKSSPEGELLLRYTYFMSDFAVSTGFSLGERWTYSIAPGIAADYNYDTKTNVLGDAVPDDAVSLTFDHSVGTGRIDWYRNFRDGWSTSFSNGISYAVTDGEVSSNVRASYQFFEIFGVLNPSVRGRLQYYFRGDELSQGGDIRGVSDSRVFGRAFLKMNTNLAIRVLDIPKFSEFNLVPFIDGALAVQEDDTLDGDNLFLGGGMDLLMFPHFLRGFQARVSFGVNLRDLPSSFSDFGSYEISITETLSF